MSRYILYTYQFAPVQIRANLFDDLEHKSSEVLMQEKQMIFADVMTSDNLSFRYKNKIYGHKIILNDSGIIVFRIANQKNISVEKNFHQEKIEYNPSCLVVIDNRNDVQNIAVEIDSKAFSDTETVVKIISTTLNKVLYPIGLSISIQKVYKKSEFWNITNKYKDKIELVRFHFTYPNLPRVNQSAKAIIAATSKITNSKHSSLELKAADGESLELSENDILLKDLADYASESGDVIDIKAKGVRGFIKTGTTCVNIEIGNLESSISKDLFQKESNKLIEILNKLIRP